MSSSGKSFWLHLLILYQNFIPFPDINYLTHLIEQLLFRNSCRHIQAVASCLPTVFMLYTSWLEKGFYCYIHHWIFTYYHTLSNQERSLLGGDSAAMFTMPVTRKLSLFCSDQPSKNQNLV